MKVHVLVDCGNDVVDVDTYDDSKYQTVGTQGELIVTDKNGIWIVTYAKGCWLKVWHWQGDDEDANS